MRGTTADNVKVLFAGLPALEPPTDWVAGVAVALSKDAG
jgi:hypothetical protein